MATVSVEPLLDELAKARAEGPDVATTSLNVVAFVENEPRLLSLLSQRLESLRGLHPTRSVLLDASRAAGEHDVQTEDVRLGVQHVGAAELRSIVHDLAVPSVRTILLWAGEHVNDPRFAELAQLADVAVLFSSARDAGLEQLHELLGVMQTPLGPKIRDLSYLRLMPWQDLVAQLFDDTHLVPELGSIRRVDVRCGSEPEAYYLAGWLASRLSWEACGSNEFCNPHGETITFDFARSGMPRRIESVRLQSEHCRFGVTIDERSDDVVCLTVEGKEHRSRRCVPLHDVDVVSLLQRAIFEPPASDIFGQTLSMVARLLEHTS